MDLRHLGRLTVELNWCYLELACLTFCAAALLAYLLSAGYNLLTVLGAEERTPTL
jgi:hypothetical protein